MTLDEFTKRLPITASRKFHQLWISKISQFSNSVLLHSFSSLSIELLWDFLFLFRLERPKRNWLANP